MPGAGADGRYGLWLEGAAYVFARDCADWSLAARVTPSDGVPGASEYFGTAVSGHGGRIFVGAYMKRGDQGVAPGAAYSYDIRR